MGAPNLGLSHCAGGQAQKLSEPGSVFSKDSPEDSEDSRIYSQGSGLVFTGAEKGKAENFSFILFSKKLNG